MHPDGFLEGLKMKVCCCFEASVCLPSACFVVFLLASRAWRRRDRRGEGLEALDPDFAARTRLWDGKGIPDRYIVIFLVNEEISCST